ncbi:hypothetical protein BDGGKGIB_01867 [Nodularia sphaerocarpa UHCC 0038]|nr:hypothetical protein BDGGKGIB_01867 [Nodularia sphaerocarpa UHCC 0038]
MCDSVMAFPDLQVLYYLYILRSVGVGMATQRKLSNILSTINDVINTPVPTPCLHLCLSVYICGQFILWLRFAIADVETRLIRSLPDEKC